MKTEEAKEKIAEMLKEKTTLTPQEINHASKGTLPFVQIYTILGGLVKTGAVQLNEADGKKSYTLLDANKFNEVADEKTKKQPETTEPVKQEERSTTKPKFNQGGRDLTKYKFNGNEYNKGRLAWAVVAQYAKEKKASLKMALEIFKDELIPPYGAIKPIKEAKQMSKERQRFFIKPEEEIKLRDAVIGVSNQWTKERIEALISIAKKQLGYTIK